MLEGPLSAGRLGKGIALETSGCSVVTVLALASSLKFILINCMFFTNQSTSVVIPSRYVVNCSISVVASNPKYQDINNLYLQIQYRSFAKFLEG